jgi:hypothetical protein
MSMLLAPISGLGWPLPMAGEGKAVTRRRLPF